MALRLYTKGKQTYRKETQLLLAAKAAAKETRREYRRLASTIGTERLEAAPAGPEASATSSSGVAVPASRRLSNTKGTTLSQSLSRSVTRSFSRVRGGSLVVGFEPGSLTPRAGITPGSGAVRRDDLGASSEEGGLRHQQLPGPAIEEYLRGTLFQVRWLAVHT